MRVILSSLFVICALGVYAQGVVSNSCDQAQNICNNVPVPFPLSTGASPNPTVPPSGSFSNPSTNPAGVNSGCLFSGELNPNWFVLNVTSNGVLEFEIGQPGGTGFYDWELWPYDPVNGCNNIANNLVAPAACNWNASSAGYTGMSNGGPPPGGVAGNFQPAIPVQAGEAYILMFSNYSYATGNVELTFPPSGASIGCSGGTPNQTICEGDAATVDLIMSPGWVNASANWLVTTNVANPTGTGITGMIIDPPVTTDYEVEIWDQGAIVDTIEFTITVVPPPTPDAGMDQVLCLGTPIDLDGTVSDPTNTITWSTDASAVNPNPIINYSPNQSAEDPSVVVNQVGTYLFILEEDNPVCGAVEDTVEVIMEDLTISASTVAPSCQGFADGEIHITSPEASEYSFDGGLTWVADTFDVVFGAGGYLVCARSPLGCEKCVAANVVDPAPVTISVSNDTLICENGTAYMSASATGGTSYLFNWDHTTNTSASQDVNPAIATTYTVIAENENGCLSPPETIDVTIRPPLSGNISAWDTICPGYPTDIWANVSGGIGTPYNFVWTSGDTQNGPDNHLINVNPPVTTDYTVTITDGCESTPLVMQTNVRVAPLPVPQYEVLDPDQCEPAVFHIVNRTDPSMSEFNYWWIEEDQEFINMDTIVTDSMYFGLYDMQMIITSYEGCVDSLTFIDALNVKPKPVADFRYSPNPVTMFNTKVNFTNYSYNGYSYEWFFPGAYPTHSTQTNVQVLYPDGQTGIYDVMLVTTSELGCVDTMKHELIVFPEVLIYAPNSFTPDDDEFNQDWRVYMEGIDIYDFELLVYDRWGELVWESHDINVAWDGTYAGRPLPSGAYTWIIRTKDMLNDDKYEYNGHVNILR